MLGIFPGQERFYRDAVGLALASVHGDLPAIQVLTGSYTTGEECSELLVAMMRLFVNAVSGLGDPEAILKEFALRLGSI